VGSNYKVVGGWWLFVNNSVVLLCFRDNPDTDIYGANLYNRYLQNKSKARHAEVSTIGECVFHPQDMTLSIRLQGEISRVNQTL